jgi:hypothetical protein
MSFNSNVETTTPVGEENDAPQCGNLLAISTWEAIKYNIANLDELENDQDSVEPITTIPYSEPPARPLGTAKFKLQLERKIIIRNFRVKNSVQSGRDGLGSKGDPRRVEITGHGTQNYERLNH